MPAAGFGTIKDVVCSTGAVAASRGRQRTHPYHDTTHATRAMILFKESRLAFPCKSIYTHREYMYSNLKSTQYLVAMLKARGIKRIVVSPGNSHNAIVRSIEEDDFFTTFSITDERSAAFFALGIIQQTLEPAAILCTSGTAASNYLTGVTEAYRRNIPLVVITADKHPYYLAQMEDQMVDQPSIFTPVTKKSVTLPEIENAQDEWYCQRLLNEAFLELNHHGQGPVHINVPISKGMFAIGDVFTTKDLPAVNLITRYEPTSPTEEWKAAMRELNGKKVMIICGQDYTFSEEQNRLFADISRKCNCILAVDALSNLSVGKTIRTNRVTDFSAELRPDIVITLNGNFITPVKYALKSPRFTAQHWRVAEDGQIADPFRTLTKVFECDALFFLRQLSAALPQGASDEYYQCWKAKEQAFTIPELPFCNLYACRKTLAQLPTGSLLNIANSTTIRIAQYFDIPEGVKVYCNRGVNGIDGCMSAYIGQSAVTDELSFLLIGDLTFFYDMNALWNRYQGKNLRIMLFNNGGAALFHFNQGLKQYPTLNDNVAAAHTSSAEGWAKAQGYTYLSAKNRETFDELLPRFISAEGDAPILFEVFTDTEHDAECQHYLVDSNRSGESPVKPQPTLKSQLGQTRVGKALKVLIGKEK